ncbi:MAG TPA: Rieske 2Fe-2S domain-containing protein [Dehalococcoidia bacterium]|nr:Rieske 2Fe-2S domain-containing protein [Dehalococcoidia bacterium]
MLGKKENEYLTRVGPGTPMGEALRRFWLPAGLSIEVEPDGSPVRWRLLCEDLVAFRDTNGKVGVMEPQCAHKRAGLFWGRNEECGLRCTYHGWKYDVDGNCVDMPNEPPDSNFKNKVKLQVYPTREKAGVIWIYMGPADKQPAELPGMEWVNLPEGYQHVTKWLQRTNWVQGMEGEIDTTHASFVHSGLRGAQSYQIGAPAYQMMSTQTASNLSPGVNYLQLDSAPRLSVKEMGYGFASGARRLGAETDNGYYWRVTHWLYPFYSLIAGGAGYGLDGGRCWMPIDDEHTLTFGYAWRTDRPFTEEEGAKIWEGAVFPCRVTRGPFTLKDGGIIDTWLPIATKENDYLIDREMQRTMNYTGLWSTNEQDRSVQESMGPIVDRSREHLGASDIAAIASRRLLIKMARDLEKGIEPACVQNPDVFRVRTIHLVSPLTTFDEILKERDQELNLVPIGSEVASE